MTSTPPTDSTRRRAVAGAAWSLPVVALGALAPAHAASPTFNARWQFEIFYDGPEILLYADDRAPNNSPIPAGFRFQITVTRNAGSGSPDDVYVADEALNGWPVAYVSSSSTDGTTPPWEGWSPISNGETWTYVLQTTAAVQPGKFIDVFDIYEASAGSNWTVTVSNITPDGLPSNNTLTWTGNLPNPGNSPIEYPTPDPNRHVRPTRRRAVG